MAAKTSNGTGGGLWGTGSTWSGGVKPAPGDTVTIAATDTVTLDENADIGTDPANTTTIVLAINGTLKLIDNPGINITFTVRGNIRIAALGRFSLGTTSIPLPSTRTFVLDFSQGNGGWFIHLDGHATVPASGSVFEAYGAASYHMADATKQRTTLAAAASLGSNVLIQFSDAVDYYANPINGDMVWLAMGGDRNTLIIDQVTGNLIADFGQEKVRLKTKLTATSYTADLTYNHLVGDMVVHGSRNLILRGANAKGFGLLIGSTVGCTIPFLDLNWVALEYACPVADNCAINFYDAAWLTTQYLEGSEVKIKNSLLDTPATGTTPVGVCLPGGYATPSVRMKTVGIDELHIWGYSTGFLFVNHMGMTRLGHVSMLNVKTVGAAQAWGIYCGIAPFKCSGLWYCADVLLAATGVQGAFFAGNYFEIGYIKSHCSYCSPYVNLTSVYSSFGGSSSGSIHYIGSGEIFNSKGGLLLSGFDGRRTHFKQLKFANMYEGAVSFGHTHAQSDVLFEDCEFDRCCYKHPAGGGTAAVVSMASYGNHSFQFVRCKFGITIRNYGSNVQLDNSTWWGCQGRIVFEDCEAKQPQGTELTMAALTNAIKWLCHASSNLTATTRKQQLPLRTFEFIRPKSYNSAGVDQWPVAYPDVDYLALVGGGGEVRNEITTIRDSSFAMKLLPYTYLVENSGTRGVPIKIPVDKSQTITVKLYIRKNHTVPVSQRPGIRLEGLGIYESAEMTDAINTWEQLTVSGTALVAGFVEFWVHSGFNDKKSDGGAPTAWIPEDLEHIIVYADELVVTLL